MDKAEEYVEFLIKSDLLFLLVIVSVDFSSKLALKIFKYHHHEEGNALKVMLFALGGILTCLDFYLLQFSAERYYVSRDDSYLYFLFANTVLPVAIYLTFARWPLKESHGLILRAISVLLIGYNLAAAFRSKRNIAIFPYLASIMLFTAGSAVINLSRAEVEMGRAWNQIQ